MCPVSQPIHSQEQEEADIIIDFHDRCKGTISFFPFLG